MISYKELWEIQEPILAMAGIIQVYLQFSGKVNRWKDSTAKWWVNLQLIAWPDRHQISEKFLDIFEIIYGKRTLSLRRILTSVIFSLFFIVCFYWLFVRICTTFFKMPDEWVIVKGNPYFLFLGYHESTIYLLHPYKILTILYDSLGINIIPDFISLAETAFILRLASKKDANLLSLVFLDFFLTTLIFIVGLFVAILYTKFIIYGGSGDILEYIKFNILSNTAFVTGSVPYWAAAAATTYTTSILWVLFIIYTLCLAILKRASTVVIKALESPWVTQLPVVLVFGIPCLVAWPVLFILRIIT